MRRSYRRACRPRGGALDGLWTRPTSLRRRPPEGATRAARGCPRLAAGKRTGPAAVLVSRRLEHVADRGPQAKLMPGRPGPFSPEAYQWLLAATTTDRDDEEAQWRRLRPAAAAARAGPDGAVGPTMVLTAEERAGRDEVLAANGDCRRPHGRGRAARLLRQTTGEDGTGGRSEDSPALAAATVDRATRRPSRTGTSRSPSRCAVDRTDRVLTGRERLTSTRASRRDRAAGGDRREPDAEAPARGDFAIVEDAARARG